MDAWDQPLADRAAFVAQACGADDGLLQHVLSLVDAMAQAGDRFETPALAMPGAAVAAPT